MNQIYIKNHTSNDFTLVSNQFLDSYMPEANGEFVKIYLYLLRAMSNQSSQFSLLSIADTLNCTEKDIERALKYWCKKNILELSFDEHKHVVGITFLPLEDNCVTSEDRRIVSLPSAEIKVPEPVSHAAGETALTTAPDETPKPKTLTPSRVKELKSNDDIIQLLFIAEQYLGKTLSPTETSRLLFFYEELHFSADLIEYLIEYCVSKGSKSIRYIEKVALAWHEDEITTVEKAKQDSNTYNKNYFTILKSMGISSRNPIDSEIQLMNRWLNDYGFTLDIICEACSRAVSQTGKASFAYADGILTSWSKKEVRALADIQNLDNLHQKAKSEKVNTPVRAKTPNKFNNFPQREYDYNDLEKQLLNK